MCCWSARNFKWSASEHIKCSKCSKCSFQLFCHLNCFSSATSMKHGHVKCKFEYAHLLILVLLLLRIHSHAYVELQSLIWCMAVWNFYFDYFISVVTMYIWISKHFHLIFDLSLKQSTSNATSQCSDSRSLHWFSSFF